ncbi:MAG: DUF4388 domain-containing protein [Gemmatimonadaceae bacterium]
MPIEGPLRELGLQDVFQLLDLSRKTGVLRVTSRMRDDEGQVYFDQGRVAQAGVRSKPMPAIDPSAISEREFDRRLKAQIEVAVYDLMSWREGFFSFEERELTDLPGDRRVRIATESLLMESARRIDEWSRLADKIPHLRVVPVLAEVVDDHESQLDLLPHEWEVLSLIDGQRDLRAIADLHARDEFETAKVVYGLVTTGVVEIRPIKRVSVAVPDNGAAATSTPPSGSPLGAPSGAPSGAPLGRLSGSQSSPEVLAALDRGYAAVRSGDFAAARANLERFLLLAPDHPDAARARGALEAATTLLQALDAHGRG